MENEVLNIFDEKRNHIGVADREDIHKRGYWHETFHCWFLRQEGEEDYIYVQLRSDQKKDIPNLLDITAAGHLLATETTEDGVREVKEEIGYDLDFDDLIPLGVIDDCITDEQVIDNELAHVMLYVTNQPMHHFSLQSEEVAGMLQIRLDDFEKLWTTNIEAIPVNGFKINESGEKQEINQSVGKDSFVPHSLSYYQTVIQKIKQEI